MVLRRWEFCNWVGSSAFERVDFGIVLWKLGFDFEFIELKDGLFLWAIDLLSVELFRIWLS
jgi:hypothetical protein